MLQAQLLSQGLLIYSFTVQIEGGMLRLTAASRTAVTLQMHLLKPGLLLLCVL